MYRPARDAYSEYIDPDGYGDFCERFYADDDNDVSAALATIKTITGDGWWHEVTEKLFLIEFEKRHEYDLSQAWKFRGE